MTNLLQIIAGVPHAAFVVDSGGTVRAANERCTAICGDEAVAAVPCSFDSFFGSALATTSPWRPSGDWSADCQVLRRGVGVAVRYRPNSEILVRASLAGDAQTIVTLIDADGDDIGVFHRSEMQTRETLDAVMRNVNSAVFVLDAAGTILDCNGIAEQLEDDSAGESAASHLIGSTIDDVVSVRQLGERFLVRNLIDRARDRDRDLCFSTDIQVSPRGRQAFDAELTVAPVRGSGGGDGQPAAILFVRDAAEQRQVWQDLRKIQHAREISRAAVGLAHELNNSATALMNHLSLLDHHLNAGGAPAAAELQSAQSAVRRIRRLGLQLERFSGAEPLDHERSDDGDDVTSPHLLTELVQDTVGLAVSGTGIRSSFAIDAGLPAVRIPGNAFSQALFNVVINSVEAMDEGGRLHIDVREAQRAEAVIVEVRDEGHGMDPRIVQKILQPYFSTKAGGIGMGLTVTLSILESYSGRVEVETEPGFGTAVRLFLPTATSIPEPRERSDDRDAGGESFSDARVLLVEDDPLVRRSLERTLEAVGCIVTAVESGDRAIDVFQTELAGEHPFQLMITDLTMPGRNDGVQLLRRVRELDPDIPAVLSSGALHRQNASSYRDAGFQYVLRKPFGEPEVRYALSVALARAV